MPILSPGNTSAFPIVDPRSMNSYIPSTTFDMIPFSVGAASMACTAVASITNIYNNIHRMSMAEKLYAPVPI